MNYRHIKRICRGEAPPKFEIINEDMESGEIDIILRHHIYNVVYAPSHYGKRYRDYDYWSDHIIIETENPVYWFAIKGEEIHYFIGVKLDDLMRVLLESKLKTHRVWGASVAEIFRIYIKHLKWRLKHEGIKFTNADFKGIRDVDSYNLVNRPQIVYSVMARIFINFTKQNAKWQMK